MRANWACNTYWGSRCYANFNLVLVDDGRIDIGDHTMFGPNVTIVTTGHTIRPDIRAYGTPQFSAPVSIGRNVWIGAGAIIMPGVSIGGNTVIGQGPWSPRTSPPTWLPTATPARSSVPSTTTIMNTSGGIADIRRLMMPNPSGWRKRADFSDVPSGCSGIVREDCRR